MNLLNLLFLVIRINIIPNIVFIQCIKHSKFPKSKALQLSKDYLISFYLDLMLEYDRYQMPHYSLLYASKLLSTCKPCFIVIDICYSS